jgi:hypothetical protein
MLNLKRTFEGITRAPRAQGIAIGRANAGMRWYGHSPVNFGVLKTL